MRIRRRFNGRSRLCHETAAPALRWAAEWSQRDHFYHKWLCGRSTGTLTASGQLYNQRRWGKKTKDVTQIVILYLFVLDEASFLKRSDGKNRF
jgi:hypothetical protein